jgi:hypothetical protein
MGDRLICTISRIDSIPASKITDVYTKLSQWNRDRNVDDLTDNLCGETRVGLLEVALFSWTSGPQEYNDVFLKEQLYGGRIVVWSRIRIYSSPDLGVSTAIRLDSFCVGTYPIDIFEVLQNCAVYHVHLSLLGEYRAKYPPELGDFVSALLDEVEPVHDFDIQVQGDFQVDREAAYESPIRALVGGTDVGQSGLRLMNLGHNSFRLHTPGLGDFSVEVDAPIQLLKLRARIIHSLGEGFWASIWPSSNTRAPLRMVLEEGSDLGSHEIYGSFLEGASRLTINDRYIGNESQIINLKDLIGNVFKVWGCAGRKTVVLHTSTPDGTEPTSQYDALEALKNEFVKSNIDFTWYLDGVHDRWIMADRDRIMDIGRGLDIFRRDGKTRDCIINITYL